MTASEFRAIRKRLGMTRAQMAEALDLSLDTINNYEGSRGPYEIPRASELAAQALLAADIRDWSVINRERKV